MKGEKAEGIRACRDVDDAWVQSISFTTALTELQAMLGGRTLVMVLSSASFYTAGFRGRLQRVRTLDSDYGAVALEFDDDQVLELAPGQGQILAGTCFRDGAGLRWLELRLGCGQTILIEQLPEAPGPLERV